MDIKLGTNLFCLFFLATLFKGAYSDQCGNNKYCPDGYYCCSYNTRCCSESALTAGMIVAIVIACIVFISCVVGGIIICIQMMTKPNRNVAPTQYTGMAVISQGQPPQYNQLQPLPPYNQLQMPAYNNPQPPAYNQQQPLAMQGQPSASASYGTGNQQSTSSEKPGLTDPAYPPPAATY